ncbi:MAG TPA: LptE family protein [Gemmatimonadales bacterium]
MSSPSWRWIPERRSRRRCGAVAASLAGLALGGCLYGFAGGGLPNIKTVAILPFDNDTPEPALTTEVANAVHEAIEGRLGLRAAGEATADAVVRGRIARYDPDLPIAVQAGTGEANVTRRQVQLTVDISIVDQRDGRTLWQHQGLTILGDYQPPQEAEGRKVALQKLVTEIVDGAQSQW